MPKLKPFPIIELVVKEILQKEYPGISIGGDLSYVDIAPRIWVSAVQGAGRNDQINGVWFVDIDVFHTSFSKGMTLANDIEALLLGGAHVTSRGVIDRVRQSSPPTEVPWKDDKYYRVACTYSFEARRSG